MPRIIVVNDRWQKNYRYELVAPEGKEFDSEFQPQVTPAQMLKLGVFGGAYF